MHTRVGPAAGVGANCFACQQSDGSFERFLHGAVAGLGLPAAEVRAVVTERELEVPHREQSGLFSGRQQIALDQDLGDLDGVGGRSLAEVVRYDPEV